MNCLVFVASFLRFDLIVCGVSDHVAVWKSVSFEIEQLLPANLGPETAFVSSGERLLSASMGYLE